MNSAAFEYRATMPRPLSGRGGSFLPVKIVILPLVLTAALWALSPHTQGVELVFCSFLLILLPWWAYCAWAESDKRIFPIFPVIGLMYVLAYVLPLYLGTQLEKTAFGPRPLTEDSTKSAMWLAVVGVLALAAGLYVKIPGGSAFDWKMEFETRPIALHYVRLVFLASTATSLFTGIGAAGAGGRQVLVDIDVVISVVAFLALLRRFLRGRAELLDGILLGGFVVLRIAKGVASGWLGSAAWFLVIIGICFFDVRRTVPKKVIIVILLSVIFLQAGKGDFRRRYWSGVGVTKGSGSERISYWFESSYNVWRRALERPERRNEPLANVVTRASLFEPTALVMQMTPSQVPFQNGRLYRYLWVTWIPRAIWPDKPSFSEANQFYQVAYGITDRRDLGKVSMAVGTLPESYINFGWFGPPFVMLFLGLLLNAMRRYFLDADRGEFLRCVGIALLPNLMQVESQMAQYLGGLVQAVALCIVIFLPALTFARQGRQQPPTSGARREIF